MNQGREAPPTTTLTQILTGLPPVSHPLDLAVEKLEQSLGRLEQLLRKRAAESGKQ